MPELPIYPQRREAPGYALERRLGRLSESGELPALRELRAELVRETLRLTGGDPDDDALDRAQHDAIAAIEKAAKSDDVPKLTLIRQVHRLANPRADGSFRSSEAKAQFKNARSSPPRFVQSKLENLLDWLAADSGREMFPAERMALWFARFVEIAPFENGNFRTGHLMASFFARSAGYPPVSLKLADAGPLREEIDRAIIFDTGPLVSRFSDAISRALDVCEKAASENR